MQLRKVVLGLAAVTMLASCAKEVTKEEAIKIARENYDASNQVYKSGHLKVVTEVTYSDNVPEELKTEKGGTKETDVTTAEQIAEYRMNSALIESCPDNTKFQADGAKLTIKYSESESSLLGASVTIESTFNLDEIGYVLSSTNNVKTTVTVSEGVTYTISVKSSLTATWTK